MVDKATARMLVYGALGLLAVVLIVAIYAIATKSSLQSELDAKLEQLTARDRKLEEEKRINAQANARFERASKEKEDAQAQRDQYKELADDTHKDKESLDKEAHLLRRRLWDKEDQQRMETLEGMDEEKLRKELEQEGEEFFREAEDLAKEHPDEDEADLELENKAAKQFKHDFDQLKEKLQKPGEDSEQALENIQEVGEQNEVYLDELDRDAKKHGKKWNEGKRPSRMAAVAHEMDLHAEALRRKYAEHRLDSSKQHLEGIRKKAKDKKFRNDPMGAEVDEIAHQIELDEGRLRKKLGEAQDGAAAETAEKLEEDAERSRVKVAKARQEVEDSSMSAEEKKEHEELLDEVERELENAEKEGEKDLRGLERKSVRHDAVRLAKSSNALAHEPDLVKLKHANAVIQDVNDTLKKEGELLELMKSGQDLEREEKLGEELGEEAADLEEDAEHLYDEAEAGDFNDLDEKLLGEQLAKELESGGADMEHDAEEVDEDDRDRALREAGEDIEEQAQILGKDEAKFGAQQFKEDAVQLEKEANELGRAVGEQAWDEEVTLADKAFADAKKLEEKAQKMEHDMELDKELSVPKKQEDIKHLKQIEKDAQNLEHEAKAVKEEVRQKAIHKAKHAQQELDKANKFAG